MSAQRKVWKVRAATLSIGCLEKTAMANWPSKRPKPKASLGPPTPPTLSRSKPEGTPVLEGARKT